MRQLELLYHETPQLGLSVNGAILTHSSIIYRINLSIRHLRNYARKGAVYCVGVINELYLNISNSLVSIGGSGGQSPPG